MTVTEDDLALVRRLYVEFGDRFERLRDEGVEDWFEEFYAPDLVIENVDNFPTAGRYEGSAGYREFFDTSYGSYRDVDWRLDCIEARDDRVLVLSQVSGKPLDDDVELTIDLGITYEMRDGKIGYVRVYVGHDRARAAASSGG